ncbi:hypothetical protein LPJ73_000057 [Coemansia sp. RSA 2703]|nr:hypothetical protein LPJ73_000057 [Coemansia sp. RSA 2703]KAJ2368296.1 hypothetical protein IW150_005449 [Coemansia sp. RSA 2607]KAJ2390231.1 hypothetical protein GGI05_003271 [Coemansia sp. RSA 2603]
MANIAATFTSGLVLGFGTVYAFTTHFTERSYIMKHKLHRASLLLKEAATGSKQSLPVWEEEKPEIMNKYQRLASHISENAIPLAKTEWNSTVATAAGHVTSVSIDTDSIVSGFQK